MPQRNLPTSESSDTVSAGPLHTRKHDQVQKHTSQSLIVLLLSHEHFPTALADDSHDPGVRNGTSDLQRLVVQFLRSTQNNRRQWSQQPDEAQQEATLHPSRPSTGEEGAKERKELQPLISCCFSALCTAESQERTPPAVACRFAHCRCHQDSHRSDAGS